MSKVKLKALRAKVGAYGRVAANGIVEVDVSDAERLVKTGGFVKATEDDIKAAQKRQKEFLNSRPAGYAGFSPLPSDTAAAEKAKADAEAAEKAKADAEAAEKAKAGAEAAEKAKAGASKK